MKNSSSGFTTKRAERQTRVFTCLSEASAGREAVRGFTLIETMIAVTILTLSVSGPLFTASRAIVAAQISRDQLTASYLAQEGIEYIRMMRDDEYLALYPPAAGASAAAWTSFLTGSGSAAITQCRAPATCTLDPARSMGTGSGFALLPCSGASCTPLYLANGIYTEQSGILGAVQTPFTRVIQTTPVSANDERVVSTVTWSFHGTPYTVSVIDHLTPWQ
ncbi:MAG: prepilin-type N-terminal cleavage/methylation domain-containing protein [Minisyncoccia bacterium]